MSFINKFYPEYSEEDDFRSIFSTLYHHARNAEAKKVQEAFNAKKALDAKKKQNKKKSK